MNASTERLSAALDGRYRIVRHLGAGGMATVYLCEDLKHDRKVALKVLKPELAAVLGAERFVVEIKTTAALQHPHILPLFDSGTADGFLYYVMPYIAGETIRDRLNRETQLPVDEAVRIAREIADALDYAHRSGVIHRDIKPENILLHDGRAMVMDFGIALAVSAAAGGRMTETGLSLGTPHYMSPEQATAEKELSGRSDIYSLASVLYEMLAGEPPHSGNSAQQIIMKIITDTARPVSELRKSVPPHVAAAIAKGLEKLPADRFATAKQFSDALATETFAYGSATSVMRGVNPRGSNNSRRALVAACMIAAIAVSVAAWEGLRTQPPPPVARLDLTPLTQDAVLDGDVGISPDGTMLSAEMQEHGLSGIYVRHLDGDGEFRFLSGTENGSQPAFSYDSRWITFRKNRALMKVPVAGGGPTQMETNPSAQWMHWGAPGLLVHSGPGGTFIRPTNGGESKRLLRLTARRPFLLPDGSGVIDQIGQDVVFYNLRTDSITVLVRGGVHPTYAASGHLLYVTPDGGLFAAPFDIRKHVLTGDPVRVIDRVGYSIAFRGYSVSNNGTLVLYDGPPSGSGISATQLFVVVRFGGGMDTLRLPRGGMSRPTFSPDGRRLAYVRAATDVARGGQIFVYDLVTGTNTQVTFDGNNDTPEWSPDGSRIAYAWDSAGVGNRLRIIRSDNSGAAVVLSPPPASQNPTQWPKEDLLLVNDGTAATQGDLGMLEPKAAAPLRHYLQSPESESAMMLSPDGTLAVFAASSGSGTDVWIREFPTPQGRWKVTPSGGEMPRWSPDGTHIYYWKRSTPKDSLFRVPVTRRPGVTVGTPELVTLIDASGIANWDLHPDGKRFVLAIPDAPAITANPGTARHLVVLNWFTELRAKLAASR